MFAVAMSMVVADAATWTWKTEKGDANYVYLPGGESTVNGLTAYLFTSGTQESVYDTWVAYVESKGKDDTWASTKLDSSTVTDGAIAGKSASPFTKDAEHIDAFFAIATKVQGDDGMIDVLYISTVAGADKSDVGAASISFKDNKTPSSAAVDSATLPNAGWYSAPEPTSGMLLLLGFAGLALRRKRA